MFQKFHNNTLYSNYIKYLLQQTYIPTVPFTSNINHVTKDCTYIHDGYFVKALKSEDMLQINQDLQNKSNYFISYEPYIFGRNYPGLTTNYTSNTDSYDPETHYYLGQYLKAYKAYYGIDLFPYYNCFSDEYASGIILTKIKGADGNDSATIPYIKIQKNTSNTSYKIVSVPISLCQEYTIAIDCSEEVLMCPVFMGKKGILEEQTAILHSTLSVASHPNVHNRSNYIYSKLSFNDPVYFFSPCIPGVYSKAQTSLPQYEKYLRLLIRLPASNSSSIVVLQGHHKNLKYYQDRIINLDIDQVSKHFTQVKEEDYLAGNNYYLYNKNYTLKNYGGAKNIVTNFPCLLNSVSFDGEDFDRKDGEVNQQLLRFGAPNNNYQGSLLNLKIEGVTFNEGRNRAIQLKFPLDTPCIHNLDVVGGKLKSIRFVNPNSQNISTSYIEYPYDNQVKSYKYRRNGNIVQSENVSIFNQDIIEVQAIKDNQFSSKWSFPVTYYAEPSSKTIPANPTILKDGKTIWSLKPNHKYRYSIIEGNKTFSTKEFEVDEAGNVVGKTLKWPKLQDGQIIKVTSQFNNGEEQISSRKYSKSKITYKLIDNFNQNIFQISPTTEKSSPTILVDGKKVKLSPLKMAGENPTWSSPVYVNAANSFDIIIEYGTSFTLFSNNYCLKYPVESSDIQDIPVEERIPNNYIISNNISYNTPEMEKQDPPSEYSFEFTPNDAENIFTLNLSSHSQPDNKEDWKLTPLYSNWIETKSILTQDINQYLNQYLHNNLTLLKFNDGENYAFVSRLMEYLINNVITKNDKFSKNIKTIQTYMDSNPLRYSQKLFVKDGEWSNELRIKAFETANKYRQIQGMPNLQDINGFIDKDTESSLKSHYYNIVK